MKIVYPGTFDPFSLGHLDLVERAASIFKNVVVAVSYNAQKAPRFPLEERIHMAKLSVQGINGVEVQGFSCLLVEFMRQHNTKYVLRGLRGVGDFEYEFQMAQANRSMLPGFEPIFLLPGEKYMVLSSTIIREVELLGGDISSFLAPDVNNYLAEKYKKGEK